MNDNIRIERDQTYLIILQSPVTEGRFQSIIQSVSTAMETSKSSQDHDEEEDGKLTEDAAVDSTSSTTTSETQSKRRLPLPTHEDYADDFSVITSTAQNVANHTTSSDVFTPNKKLKRTKETHGSSSSSSSSPSTRSIDRWEMSMPDEIPQFELLCMMLDEQYCPDVGLVPAVVP